MAATAGCSAASGRMQTPLPTRLLPTNIAAAFTVPPASVLDLDRVRAARESRCRLIDARAPIEQLFHRQPDGLEHNGHDGRGRAAGGAQKRSSLAFSWR